MRGTVILGVALVAAIAGGSAVLAGPSTNAMRVVMTGRGPMLLAVDARAGHALVVNYSDGSGPGSIDMLDATNGTLQQVIPVGMFPHAIAMDDRRGRAFVANEAAPWHRMGDSLSVVDTRGGWEIRRLPLPTSTVTVGIDRALGRVFIALQNNRLQMLDAATLRFVGTIGLGFGPSAMVADERHARVVLVGHTAGGTARATALDARSGRILWTTAVGSTPLSLAIDGVQDRVFVADGGNGSAGCAKPGGYCRMFSTVSTLDGRTGRLLHTASVGQDPNNIVVDEATRRVFAMNMGNNPGDGGTVSVLDARTGRILRTTTVGYQPRGAAVDVGRDRVFVSNGGDATISILDARDGHMRGTWRVVDGPGPAAVDERTGRVFVNSNDVSNGSPNYYIPDCRRSIFAQIGCVVGSLSYQARELRKGRTGTVSTFDARTAP